MRVSLGLGRSRGAISCKRDESWPWNLNSIGMTSWVFGEARVPGRSWPGSWSGGGVAVAKARRRASHGPSAAADTDWSTNHHGIIKFHSEIEDVSP